MIHWDETKQAGIDKDKNESEQQNQIKQSTTLTQVPYRTSQDDVIGQNGGLD